MDALIFIKDLLLATLGQMATLFLGFFIFGLLIHFVSQLMFKSLVIAFGRFGAYFVAWLGTPVHELGHALFCLIFFHRIETIKFFEPDPVTGTLGYVTHTWSRKNPWQVLGNFFIGVGPVLLRGANPALRTDPGAQRLLAGTDGVPAGAGTGRARRRGGPWGVGHPGTLRRRVRDRVKGWRGHRSKGGAARTRGHGGAEGNPGRNCRYPASPHRNGH